MRSGYEVVDEPVVTMDEGRRLGTVKGLYLDRGLNRVEALYLGSEGLLSRTPKFIERQHLRLIGVDVLLVERSDIVREGDKNERWTEWIRLDELKGREVRTPGGTRIGRVGDVLLDDRAQVAGFTLSRVYVEGPISEHQSLTRAAVINPGGQEEPMTVRLEEVEEPEVDVS